jgi:hypothetical protein
MKRLWGYVLVVALAAIVTGIILKAIFTAVPGLVLILPFYIFWWSQELAPYDLDAELAALIREGR